MSSQIPGGLGDPPATFIPELGPHVTAVFFGEDESPSARREWRRARANGIGSSEVSAILGMHPSRSAWSVWETKMRERSGRIEERNEQEDEALLWGNRLEAPVAEEASRRMGRPFANLGRWTLMQNSKLAFPLLASLDRIIAPEVRDRYVEVGPQMPLDSGAALNQYAEIAAEAGLPCRHRRRDPASPGMAGIEPCIRREHWPGFCAFEPVDPRGAGLYEGKNAGYFVSREEWRDEGPVEHIVQLQAQLIVCDLEWGVVGGLVGGNKLHLHEHDRDREFEAFALERLEEFWKKNVLRGEPPPVDDKRATSEAIGRFYDFALDHGTGAQTLSSAGRACVANARAIKKQIRDLERSLREQENAIKAELGMASDGYPPMSDPVAKGSPPAWPSPVVTWRQVRRAAPSCGECGAKQGEDKVYRQLRYVGEKNEEEG